MQPIFSKHERFVLLPLLLLAFLAFLNASVIWAAICLSTLALLSLIQFRLVLFFYICLLPVWGFIGGAVTALSASYILIAIFLMRLVFGKEDLLGRQFLLLIFVIIFFILLGSLVSGYYEYFHTILIFVSVSLTSYVIANQIIKDENNLYYIASAFIAAAAISFIGSFILSGGEFRRLTLGGLSRSAGGEVRDLADILGVSLMLIPVFFKRNNLKLTRYITYKPWLYFFVCLFLLGLIFTSSRGVVFAVLASFTAYLFFKYKFNLKIFFLSALFFLFFYLVFYQVINWFEIDSVVFLLEERMRGESVEGGLIDRLKIWQAGLSNMGAIDYLFGHGLASFRYLALKSGVDFYSHSTFVAIITDVGLIPLLILLIFMAKICLIKNNRALAVSLLIYVTLSHITAGSLNSEYFWRLLAIAYAISILDSKGFNTAER